MGNAADTEKLTVGDWVTRVAGEHAGVPARVVGRVSLCTDLHCEEVLREREGWLFAAENEGSR